MSEVDVLILGAGISGSVTAAMLARLGYRVVMVSRDSGTAHHLPESWVYTQTPSIRALEIETQLQSAFVRETKTFFFSCNGEQNIEVSTRKSNRPICEGDLVRVERNQFDKIFLESAMRLGAQLLPQSRLVDCQFGASGGTVTIESQGVLREWAAPWIVDATGKTMFLSNHLRLPVKEHKLDPRIAYFSHFECPTDTLEGTRIIALEWGYIFCIPVSENRVSIGCVLPESKAEGTPEAVFASTLAQSQYAQELIREAKRVLPVIPAKNHQRICLEPAGNQYLLVGDAAAFLDPFFCPGIDFAFFSAEQAVAAIENRDSEAYKSAIHQWLTTSQKSVYQKLETSDLNAVLRLFADPHLPQAVSLMLTQAFTQVTGKPLTYLQGIEQARRAYELALH